MNGDAPRESHSQTPISWPPLPLAGWEPTRATLHMMTQIVGKTRLGLAPMQNHWWQVALYLTTHGLTTSSMPCDQRAVNIEFNFRAHQVQIETSDGRQEVIMLSSQSVAEFFREYMDALAALEIEVRLMPVPVEVVVAIPFAEEQQHAYFDADAVQRWWQILVSTARVMERFRSHFMGKASPVHFFWGSFDLATTRFSGRSAPRHPGGAPNCPDYVMVEAYSHECSSWGFWPGGGAVAEPAFYAYAYPEPKGYAQWPVRPDGAYYHPELREFVLPYEKVRTADDPDGMLEAFLQSTYEAAAETGKWDRAALDRKHEPPRPQLTQALRPSPRSPQSSTTAPRS
jgi:hypothetical protein